MIPMIPLDKYPLIDQNLPEYEIRKDGVIWNNLTNKQVFMHPKSKAVAFWSYSLQKPAWFQYHYLYAYYFLSPWSDHAFVKHASLKDFGYGRHIVTEDGRLWSMKYMKYVAVKPLPNGYCSIPIRNDITGTEHREGIHRLVALCFCEIPSHLKSESYDKLFVNHKDGNKTNNNYWNLEWCTPSENVQHAHACGLMAKQNTKYTTEQLHHIFTLLIEGKSIQEIANLGYDYNYICAMTRGAIHRTLGNKMNYEYVIRTNKAYAWKDGDKQKVADLSEQGKTYTEIATMLKIPRHAICRFIGGIRNSQRGEYTKGTIDKWRDPNHKDYMSFYNRGIVEQWHELNAKR